MRNIGDISFVERRKEVSTSVNFFYLGISNFFVVSFVNHFFFLKLPIYGIMANFYNLLITYFN